MGIDNIVDIGNTIEKISREIRIEESKERGFRGSAFISMELYRSILESMYRNYFINMSPGGEPLQIYGRKLYSSPELKGNEYAITLRIDKL